MESQTVCRICHCLVGDNEFDPIEEIITHVLDMLLLKLQINDHIKPIVCNVCAKSLKEAFDFKMACLNVEHKLLEFTNSKEDVKVDLKELYLKEDPSIIEANEIVEYQRICRFCLTLKAVDCCTSLNESKKNMFILDTLQNHIPELNLSITEELITCETCLDALQNFHKFTKICLKRLRASQELDGTVIKKENNANESLEINGEQLVISMESDIKSEDAVAGENFNSTIKNEESVDNMDQDCSSTDTLKLQHNTADPRQCKRNSSGIAYTCDRCMYETSSNYYFKKHLLNHKQPSEVTTYKCNVCSCYKHKDLHKDPSDISKCAICHKHKTKQKDPLEISVYKCDMCTYEAKHKRNLQHHVLSHKNKGKITLYKCDQCIYESKCKNRLKYHKLIHKNTSNISMFGCDVCSYKSKYEGHIKRHLQIHKIKSRDMKLYKCDICTYETWIKRNLTLHYIVHKDPSEVEWFKCELCSYKTKYHQALWNHKLKHKDPPVIKMYKCDECPYQTKMKCDLTKHVIIHKQPWEITMYKCEVCSFETKHKRYINTHMRIHKKHKTDLV